MLSSMTSISIIVLIFTVISSPLYCQEILLSPLCTTVCACGNIENKGFVELDCSRSRLSIVPPVSDWPNNITHLELSNNNITALDVELAQGTLKVLDLSYNKIRKVVQSAFGGLKSLKYLNLANNDIREFEEDGFYGLDQLKSLNISSNALHVLPDKLFYHFIGLQELCLADNPLVHLDPIHFNRMINLKWLDLSYIDAYTLDSKIFHTTGQLEFLDLSGNEFTDVPTDALRSAKTLKYLKLNENLFTTLNKKSFTKLSTLEVLELNYLEKLKEVEDEAFSDLISLRILEIKHGRHLSYVSPHAFNGLFNTTRPTLQELDLQGNQLRTLQQTMVPCGKLKKFNIQQNPWNCDCMLRWVKDCHIQLVYAADLKCASPSRVDDSLLLNLEEDDLRCDFMESEVAREEIHHDRLVRSISVGLGVTFLVILAFGLGLVFKWRDMKEWYRKTRKGPGAVYYVRAMSNPREI